MTPTVNLLPARYAERIVDRHWARLVVAALLVLLALFALASFSQSRQLGRAEKGRDVEQAENAKLQERRRQLAPFAELAAAVVGRERLLTAAMQTEVSWATVLASLSLSFPADASLTSLTLESKLPAFGAVPPVSPGNESSVIGTTTLKGYSVREFTPGVERTLQLLVGVTGLSEPRLQVGTAEEIGERPVTTFEGNAFIDGAALTGRYADGLPPEDDVDVPAISAGGVAAAVPSASTRKEASN